MSTYATIAIRMDELGRIEDAELSAGLGAAAGVELSQALLSSCIAQVVEGIDPAHALQFINRYADRLLFARDYYGTDLHQFLQTLPLSAAVVEKIYWQNAERLVAPPKKT